VSKDICENRAGKYFIERRDAEGWVRAGANSGVCACVDFGARYARFARRAAREMDGFIVRVPHRAKAAVL